MSIDTGAERPAVTARDSILPSSSFRPARTPAERRLAQIWSAALNVDRIGVDDDFFELGGESMTATVICAELERLTGRRADPGLLNQASTIASFVGALEGDLREDAGRSLIQIRPGGARPPLVLVHGIDGQIMFVRRLAWLMPPEQPIYGIQARGLDGRSPPHNDYSRMLDDYADQIAAALPGRAIHLGGFCLGSAMAVSLEPRLSARGVRCLGMVLIDPPVERSGSRPKEARGQLLREWYSTLAERIAPFTRWHPELAAHYAPGGEGLRHAMNVMSALASATTTFDPQPTQHPTTVIWSEERALMRGDATKRYALTKGPYRAFVVRNPQGTVTHMRLLQETLPSVASVIRDAIGLPSTAPTKVVPLRPAPPATEPRGAQAVER